jgi:hypothetical protein
MNCRRILSFAPLKLLLMCLIVPVLAGCPLPDQSKIPPTIRIRYSSGDRFDLSGNGCVYADQPLTIVVDAYSSLSGLKSLEVVPSYSFTCSNGQVAQSGTAFTTPTTKTPSGLILHLQAEVDVGSPKDNYCQSGIPFSFWAGSFKVTAVSNNGLSIIQQLSLTAPCR